MTTLNNPKKRYKGSIFLVFFFLLLISAGAIFFLFFEGEIPQAAITSPATYVGAEAVITFTAKDSKSGLSDIEMSISQGDKIIQLYSKEFERKGYTGVIGSPSQEKTIIFKPKESGFKDGPAVITLAVSDFSARNFLKGNQLDVSLEVIIDTTPPRINILHSERYISPGGTGIVIYRLDDPEARSGININQNHYPGFLTGDGRDDTYIAFFGLPYNTEALNTTFVVATDKAGNKTKVPFTSIFKKKTFRLDRIDVGNNFLDKKIPEFEQYYPEMKGSIVEKYLYTNNEVRQKNNAQISSLCQKPRSERLWSGRFLRMSGSSRAGYADHRTYYYNKKPIDKQVHLGMDIASTKHADVKAAEKGIVVYADYLGIYGNMVLLDHGQGVFSLYSHMSQINVSPGDQLDQGAVLGLTGTSGMAGGDHLHFSMLINGVFVTPKEWWDQHWVDVTIEDPLAESRF